MSMSKYDLLELAEKHRSNIGISVMLQTYSEAGMNASTALLNIKSQTKITDYIFFSPESIVPSNMEDMVMQSIALSTAMGQMNSCLFNIADVLQSLGENIEW